VTVAIEKRARFHVVQMRAHEKKAAPLLRAPECHLGDLDWRSRRVEGHALRAIVAMLTWGLS
jgi:hypothetical protein